MSIENPSFENEPELGQGDQEPKTDFLAGDLGPTASSSENEELSKIRKRNKEIVTEATKELDEIWKKAEEKAK